MPEFGQWEEAGTGTRPVPSDDFAKMQKARERAEIAEAETRLGPPKPFEPRCHVCTHHFRDFIDSLLIKQDLSYSEIARRMPPARNGRKLDHRQIGNHARRHLGVGDAAIRAILEEQASAAAQDFEEGVRGAITHRGGLEVAFRKAFEDIVNGVASVEPRDMISIGKLLKEWDKETQEVQVDVLRAQVSALIEAIKQVAPPEMWGEILDKARVLMEREEVSGVLAPAKQPEPVRDE